MIIYSIILKNKLKLDLYIRVKGNIMFQKLAPLIVLTFFAIGVYFMIQGMKGAMDMAKPENAKIQKKLQSSQIKK